MKIMVTGAKGQLGRDVMIQLATTGHQYQGVDQDDFDLTDQAAVFDYVNNYRPEIVIHCAAYTAVDKAETEKERCYAVNVNGTAYLAQACQTINAKLLYISSDYVFDGSGDTPFEIDSQPAPINYYGLTKYQGELEVQKHLDRFFIVRASWIFGNHGHNFVKTILNLAKKQPEIRVVNDQVGSPTYAYDLAKLILDLVVTDKYGIYHVTNEGFCSWYQFATEIINLSGCPTKIIPIASKDYPTPAVRPKNSRLSKNSLIQAGFSLLPHYRDALTRYLKQEVSKNS